MAKMTKTERTQVETDLATLRRAVAQCEKELAEDDKCDKAAAAESDEAAIKGIAQRDGTTAAVLACRERPNRISDAVHAERFK
jgi:Skp family chaperone for outer membrane proteins